MKTLLIDNYDSYTFNLYQLIAKINAQAPFVIRNDQVSWQDLQAIEFDNVVISPGPGNPYDPRDFGICSQVLQNCQKPILGVCLGHQGMGAVFGGKIISAEEVKHGQVSDIYHTEADLFEGIPSPFTGVRYHSLLVDRATLPTCLEITAWTDDQLIMGLRHRFRLIWGVQFHPESICTDYGDQIFENFKLITLGSQLTKTDESVSQEFKSASQLKVKTIVPSRSPSTQLSQPTIGFQVFSRKLAIAPDPEQVFVHLYGDDLYAFWLDSSQVTSELSRFSFMGNDQGYHSFRVEYYSQSRKLRITRKSGVEEQTGNILDYLQDQLDTYFCQSAALPFDFNSGFVGYFGYELKSDCGAEACHASPLPDAFFLFVTQLIAFDHQAEATYLIYCGQPDEKVQAEAWFEIMENCLSDLPPLIAIEPTKNPKPLQFRFSRSRQTYLNNIQDCLKAIQQGESYEICLTNRLETSTTPDPLLFYRHLRHQNPAPYASFLKLGNLAVACSSPERFLKINAQGWVETKPMKGTLRRGGTPQEDQQLREYLGHNEKDLAENLMVVDLLRNDLGLVCEIGTVTVPKLMEVETYATVHQLVSTVQGHLRQDLKVTDGIRAAFPGGSMTGAPKLRTMQILDRLEGEARGIYSGSIGFLGLNGTVDLNIVIRTAIVTETGTSIGVGGGIVALSDPEQEFAEILLKAQALIHALVKTIHGTVREDLYHIELCHSEDL
jgi:para-aminobenzoate synthetase